MKHTVSLSMGSRTISMWSSSSWTAQPRFRRLQRNYTQGTLDTSRCELQSIPMVQAEMQAAGRRMMPGESVLAVQACLTICNPWTVAHQAPLSMEFSRQENWSGFPFPFPGALPSPAIKPGSPTLQADSLPFEAPGKPQFLQRIKSEARLEFTPSNAFLGVFCALEKKGHSF